MVMWIRGLFEIFHFFSRKRCDTLKQSHIFFIFSLIQNYLNTGSKPQCYFIQQPKVLHVLHFTQLYACTWPRAQWWVPSGLLGSWQGHRPVNPCCNPSSCFWSQDDVLLNTWTCHAQFLLPVTALTHLLIRQTCFQLKMHLLWEESYCIASKNVADRDLLCPFVTN